MNEPIVNPLWFYLIDMAGTIVCVSLFLFIISFVLNVAAHCKMEECEEQINYYEKWGNDKKVQENLAKKRQYEIFAKAIVKVTVVSFLLFVFVPNTSTAQKMFVAHCITRANVEKIGDYTDKTFDKLIEKIIKASESIKK